MTTGETSQAPRYTTLRDYLRVLRRYWLMIAVITIIGAAAGLANALRQKPTYQASSQLSFQDPTQELTLAGIGSTPQTPVQLAEVNATTATAPEVMAEVRRRLRTSISPTALANAVSPQVSTTSGLLRINATASSANFAAELANTVADVLVDRDNRRVRAQFARIARQIRRRIAHLPRGTGAAGGTLDFYEGELARLEVVGVLANSATVAKTAQVPGGPSSPNKTRDTALGLGLGLLLAIIAAFVRDSMDRRLRGSHDIETSLDLPVLGQVRNQVMGQVVHPGGELSAEQRLDLEGFRILRRNLEFLDNPRTVVVTSAVAQEGKTTVAIALAYAMAAAGKSTLLVDADLRRPAVASRLGVEQSPGLSEYLSGAASAEDVVRTVKFPEGVAPTPAQPGSSNGHGAAVMHGFKCVASGTPTSGAAELLGSSRLTQLISEAGQAYELLIFDSSPLLPVADTLEMLPHVDAVVLCVRDGQTTRDQAVATKTILERIPGHQAGVVVTGVKPQSGEYGVYSYSYEYS